jgi:hypothetical protein
MKYFGRITHHDSNPPTLFSAIVALILGRDMRHTFIISFFLLFAASLLGCQSIPIDSPKVEALNQALHQYEVALRWGNIPDAYQMLTPELLAKTTVPAGLDNIKVTHYEILSQPTLSGDQAMQTVKIRFLHQDRQVIRTLTDRQLWTNHPDKGWRRASPIPSFQ